MGGKVYHSGFHGKRAAATPWPGRKYAIVQTWLAPDVLGCRAWNFCTLPGLPYARRFTWQAPPRRLGRCRKWSERADASRGYQQGHARRTPKKYKKGCRKTIRPRGRAKDRGGKNRFHHGAFLGHAEKSRSHRKASQTN